MYKLITRFILGVLFLPVLVSATPGPQSPDEEDKVQRPQYGTNILRFTPLTANDMGVGMGLSYEKIVDKEQMIGITLPLNLILRSYEYYYGYPLSGNDHLHTYLHFTPGLKIYPFGQRKVTYAVGPSLMFAFGGGKGTETNYDIYQNMIVSNYSRSVFRFGVLVNNYLNFQVTPKFNIGLEGGLGVRYLNIESVNYDNQSNVVSRNKFDMEIIGQLSMTLGFRF